MVWFYENSILSCDTFVQDKLEVVKTFVGLLKWSHVESEVKINSKISAQLVNQISQWLTERFNLFEIYDL